MFIDSRRFHDIQERSSFESKTARIDPPLLIIIGESRLFVISSPSATSFLQLKQRVSTPAGDDGPLPA